MEFFLCLGLFAPLLSFMGLLAAANKIGRKITQGIACGSVFISFLAFLSLFAAYSLNGSAPITLTVYQWLPIEGLQADFSLRIDPLSLLMTLIITGVGSLIHLYSIGYMNHEKDFVRFFAYMNFFIFAMLWLVLAENLLVLFVGWEGVGLASYLLIGFWSTRPAAAKAATKAFVVNRIGDFGLLLGLLLTYQLFGTGDITVISERVTQEFPIGAPALTFLTLLYFVGAIGKSAQLPLYTWLPDAMEGPTPVSALIHAATMVTAGVYLIVRLHAVFIMAPITLGFIGIIGGATALFAALCASGQTDLKRVLAYSTVSQLGFMFLACGVGAFYAAMFHLTMHAFMKSLLFLSAGNVVHMMGGVTDMGRMGGLSKVFTKTHWLFLIGALALGGIPPLAASFSKDMILEQEVLAGDINLYWIGLAASILTAFYLMRAYILSFMGPLRAGQEWHEAPNIMLVPLFILAFLSIVGGVIGFGFGQPASLQTFLSQIGIFLPFEEPKPFFLLTWEVWVAILGAFIGVAVAAVAYTHYLDRLGATWEFLKNAFFIDSIYQKTIVDPLETFSYFIANKIEPFLFLGSVLKPAEAIDRASRVVQIFQSGFIRSYIAWMVFGASFLLAIYFIVD